MSESYDVEKRLALFPQTTALHSHDEHTLLTVAGYSLADLAEKFGTPLYIFDQATLDANVQSYRSAIQKHYSGSFGITYAGKAFLCLAMAQWADRQDLWIDCTGAGEIHVAAAAGVPRKRILVHGVNKSLTDLASAITHAGTIVVDNPTELERLAELQQKAKRHGQRFPDLWLRLRPGLAVETSHSYTQTGQEDSKFGFSLEEGCQAVAFCHQHKLPLTGLHFHQGSHFHDPSPLAPAIDTVLDIILEMRDSQRWTPKVLCVGGGWGVPYHEDDLPYPPVETYISFVAQHLTQACQQRGLPLMHLQFEPGRSLVAKAGVALYRLGAVKRTTSRRWLMIDGGMADNIRPALYGARYSALPVNDPQRSPASPVWLAGPYCESGDILIEGLPMPEMQPGEAIAIPVSGAYHVSMSSNYNGACRPAVVWLNASGAHVILERERPEDLLRRDRPLVFA